MVEISEMNEIARRPQNRPPYYVQHAQYRRWRNLAPYVRAAGTIWQNRHHIKRGYDQIASGIDYMRGQISAYGNRRRSMTPARRKMARLIEQAPNIPNRYYSKRRTGGSGRGQVLRGGGGGKRGGKGGRRRRFGRKKSMFKKMAIAARNVPPPNTLRVTDQAGSLGGNNCWVYRLDTMFVQMSRNTAEASPFLSFLHAQDMCSIVGQTFGTEDQLRVEKAVDKYIVRAPTNTKTVLEVYVLGLKEPMPTLCGRLPVGGPPPTNPSVNGPLYDLSINNVTGSTENPGNITPYQFFPFARNFPPNVVVAAGSDARFDAGASQMNFHPLQSQRFRSNYRVDKKYRFVLGPSDVATFKVQAKNITLKYEDYFQTAQSATTAQLVNSYSRKSKIVLFRWHGELCQGTTSTAEGAFCNMGYSADNLLVRCERYSKARKIVQNINTINYYVNQGSATIGSGNNLATSNAALKEFGEDNNAGVAPGA